ncbi:Foldase protein PrsA precursor [Gemmata sp. SH-PL17]|uniref:peptidyl-prolyl cis-trans isomerase n=1 Tax=Gemmata sp. SH-PL17 TaxID=1630693 RepID=UPI00078D0F0D|nr:peptidyl-prolyl cis-trans isomerase [Gemmata sp. SH-PL17]AMV29985.1 Foldase protein PrsA precursor [Gemmata sp. SH-PL17]
MKLLASDRRRQLVRGLAFAGVAAAGYVFGITSDRATAQQPTGAVRPNATGGLPGTPGLLPLSKGTAQPESGRQLAAQIYGDVPVTREELGEFLIARGGHEKLELLVNKKIIETEAARRGLTVTSIEVQAALNEEMRGLGITRADFVKHILPRYGKTLFEWVEDVIKPRLLLTKMCQDRVKIADEDLSRAFENRFGERRQAKVICWSKEDLRAAQKQWAEARKGDAEFDSIATKQAEPTLAAAAGMVAPIGRYSEATDTSIEKALFSLKIGEISQLFDTPSGIMCVKLMKVIPPDETAKLDDKMKEVLRKEQFAKRIELEIPKCFTELKAQAKPVIYLKGAPTPAEFREGVENIVNQAGGVPNVPTPVVPAAGSGLLPRADVPPAPGGAAPAVPTPGAPAPAAPVPMKP